MFVKGKSCLTNLIVLYSEVIQLVDEGRKMGVYLDFSRGFDGVFHDIITD